jgi:hypothetical protein
MSKRQVGLFAAVLGACAFASAASAQVVDSQDFEESPYGDWLANGNQFVFPNGNPGQYIGVPYLDFWGVTLRQEAVASPMTGDLTVYPQLEVAVDFRMFALNNFNNEPIDPANFNLILEFVDYDNYATVYFVGPPLPQIADGWTRFTFSVPDTSQAALPPGWRGSGDEDPVTFEPRLPAGRTWQNVLQTVDEVRITTLEPGFFYGSNFWEAGFDNLLIEVPGGGGGCGSPDFDGDGDVGTDGDIEAFFACLSGTCCETCPPDADYNCDGDVGTDGDIEAFFRVLGGNPC